jgi:hypothetical protein
MSSNLGETAKKLILVCWEKARQPPPPPPAWRLDLATLTHGETPN